MSESPFEKGEPLVLEMVANGILVHDGNDSKKIMVFRGIHDYGNTGGDVGLVSFLEQHFDQVREA